MFDDEPQSTFFNTPREDYQTLNATRERLQEKIRIIKNSDLSGFM
jgi:hypothetical protein